MGGRVGTEPPTQRTDLNHSTAYGAAECPLPALAPNPDPHSVATSKLNRREWRKGEVRYHRYDVCTWVSTGREQTHP